MRSGFAIRNAADADLRALIRLKALVQRLHMQIGKLDLTAVIR
jgi:hypothetical protein